jgi:aminopeptidase N
MRWAAAALALTLGAAAVPSHAQVAAPAAPAQAREAPAERAAPPRLTVAILGYSFRISLPDSGDSISGSAVIRIRRLHAGAADTLPLDLVGMAVREVRGGPAGRALLYRYDGRVLRVILPRVARAGRDSLTVRYAGRPADGLIGGALAGGRRFFFADNWPDRARGFLPCVDHPAVKAPVTWEIEAPAGMRVVANGVLCGVADAARGRRRWVYVERRPIPTYTMVFGAAPFAVSRRAPSIAGTDTTVNEVWAFPEDSAYADSAPFRRLTALVETGSRIVGPFPYRKLAQVESATRYGGMENSSAIFYDRGMYVARRMGEGVVRHETAHQWFGDAVTERDWRHLWLSEGFASYFDLVFATALGDDSAVARGMRGSARGYFASGATDRPIVDSAAQDLMSLLNANSYNKGAWLLHMLRGEVGDSTFFRGVRDYYRAYRDSSVLSEDFERVMERAAGRDLRWFFRQWLYQPGYPQLDVVVRVDSAAGRATVRVRQVQGTAWGLFRLPRVEVRFLEGTEPVGEGAFALDTSQAEASFAFDLPRPPTSVRIDPEGRLLLTATVRMTP